MSDPANDVIKRALTDAAFKAELMNGPNAAIEKATGVKIPAGMTVKIVEDSASTVHLVLPPASAGGKRLSDKELEDAAGAGSGTKVVWQPGGNCYSTGCIR